MTWSDSMLPRQRLWMGLMVTTFLLLQVDGWSLPKTQTKLNLPLDFSILQSFYRLVALPSASEGPADPPVEWSIRRQRVHLQDGQGQSKPYKRSVIEVDSRNGSIWLIKRPEDLDVYMAAAKAGRAPTPVFVTATVIATNGSAGVSHRTDLKLEFSRQKLSFCRPSLSACFPFSAGKYVISEGSTQGREFDFLQNLKFSTLCPDTKPEYSLTSNSGLVEINKITGALTLSRSPDFEELPFFAFNATCSVGEETFTTFGEVTVVDVNDSPPTTQSGNSTATITHYIKPGQTSLHFPVTAKDRDSKSENGLEVRIEGDVLRLFGVEDVKIYGGLGNGRDTFTFLQAEIKSRGLFLFPDKEYNFSVIIEDVKLMQPERQLIYDIVLINETDTELVLKDLYEVNISRNAEQYARIIELSRSSRGYTFDLSVGDKPFDYLAVTKNAGIVYLKDPSLIPGPSSVRRNILWKGPQGKSGTILLVLTIEDDKAISCDPSSKWCSFNAEESSCVATCGKGSRTGLCSWRPGSLVSLRPRPDFATCSPDLNSCPDGHCDELEKLDHTLCPQDCAKEFSGEVVPSKSGRGLDAAVGPCHCPATDHCICIRNYPPAEMRRHKPMTSGSVPATNPPLRPPIIEIQNGSLSDEEKMFQRNLETTTPMQQGPVSVEVDEGVVCGMGCVVASTIVLACLLVIVLVVMWRLHLVCFSVQPKSGHVSLSGVMVPSDYVDEESRNTPSETSSFGKASLADGAKWEFPRSRLQLECVLGEGEFGRVMKAKAWNIGGVKGYTTVAVKMIKENGGAQEKQDLMMEFMLLKEISHPNVVRLLGASTEKSGPFYLIVEFAELGSLRTYLRRRRRHNCCNGETQYQPPDQCDKDYYHLPCNRYQPNHMYFHKEQLSFGWQIAKGMAYLSDMKLVHRDLAARNVLLAKRKVVKISDFGLSRDIYEGDAYLKKSKGRVPVKWMAIESLEDQIYTSRSDVWSFGVVLWEIMMQGATPYPGVTPQRLYNLLKAGYRMSKPENCSDEMYYLMRQCWRMPPRERPSFKELVLKLEFLLQDTVEYMDLVSKERYQRAHSRRENTTPNGPAPSIQYTSVLIENSEDDEEEEVEEEEKNGHSDQEYSESIGLVRLFCPSQDNSSLTTHLVSTAREESPA